mmetsp:Transcript_18197/g.31536  ORF Transcript_18197/g.31536 Transcript_18197/m.31536 type:complete len:289 (+) Transcript_18197:60-926(+)
MAMLGVPGDRTPQRPTPRKPLPHIAYILWGLTSLCILLMMVLLGRTNSVASAKRKWHTLTFYDVAVAATPSPAVAANTATATLIPQLDAPLQPRMSQLEKVTYEKYLNLCDAKKAVYWEFGSGGSTQLACKRKNIQKIFVVESDTAWLERLHRDPFITKAFDDERIEFIYVDINGDPTNWGFPKDHSRIEDWPAYSGAMQHVNPPPSPLVVLIDGRFRVACALHIWKYISTDAYVIIHDYSIRPNYKAVLSFYDQIESADTLVVLKKKTNVDHALLDYLNEKHKFDPS